MKNLTIGHSLNARALAVAFCAGLLLASTNMHADTSTTPAAAHKHSHSKDTSHIDSDLSNNVKVEGGQLIIGGASCQASVPNGKLDSLSRAPGTKAHSFASHDDDCEAK